MNSLRRRALAASHSLAMRVGIAVGFLALAVLPVAADDVKRILILYSNESFLPANIELGNALVSEMRAAIPGRTEFFSEFLDLVRFSGTAHQERTAEALRAKYGGRHFDLIITAGPQALDLIHTRREALFPGVPLVYSGVGPDEIPQIRRAKATGILMRLDPVPTLELALRLQPKSRRVVVVTGAAAFDRAWEAVARERFGAFENRLEFDYLIGLPMPQLFDRLRSLEAGDIVVYLSLFLDGDGQYFLSADAARQVARASAAPVYGLYDTYLGTGIVGGHMETFESVGRETARLGLRILGGEKPETIEPYFLGDGAPIVDWRQLRRWGLSESALPAGSDVRFRRPTLWEEHRGKILGVAAVVILQSALLIGLLIQRRNRRRAEQEASKTRHELAHAARLAIVGELTASIAHEINQPLGAILSNADAAEMLLDSSPESLGDVRQILDDIRKDDLRASEVIRRLRSLLRKREMELASVDLNEVISEVLALIRSESTRRGLIVDTELAANLPAVMGDKVHLQQVLLNLLLNGMEAMADVPTAKTIVVGSQRTANGSVEIAVRDSGSGIAAEKLPRLFDPFFSTKTEGMGLGLPIARSIVEAHRGRIWAENNSGGGATLRFTIPMDGRPHDNGM